MKMINSPLSYFNTTVIVFVFFVGEPASYINVTTKWIPDKPNTPIVFVWNRIDLRSDLD